MQIPIRSLKARKLSAKIQIRMRQFQCEVIELKRIGMQSEFRCDVEQERKVASGSQLNLLPLQVADVRFGLRG